MMKTIKEFLQNKKWVNKFTVAIFIFVLWISLLDGKSSLIKQYKLNKQIREMTLAKIEYDKKLADAKVELHDLMSNKEKYAREKYLIATEDEDLFIIE